MNFTGCTITVLSFYFVIVHPAGPTPLKSIKKDFSAISNSLNYLTSTEKPLFYWLFRETK